MVKVLYFDMDQPKATRYVEMDLTNDNICKALDCGRYDYREVTYQPTDGRKKLVYRMYFDEEGAYTADVNWNAMQMIPGMLRDLGFQHMFGYCFLTQLNNRGCVVDVDMDLSLAGIKGVDNQVFKLGEVPPYDEEQEVDEDEEKLNLVS